MKMMIGGSSSDSNDKDLSNTLFNVYVYNSEKTNLHRQQKT